MNTRHAGRRLGLAVVLICCLTPAVLPAQASTGHPTVKPTTRLYGIADDELLGGGVGDNTGVLVYDARTFRRIGYYAENYKPPGSIDVLVDESVQAGSNGKLAVTANGGGDSSCTYVEMLSQTGHLLGFLPDSLDQSGAGALSGDGKVYAFGSGPYAAADPGDDPSTNASCPSTVDHIEVAPTGTLVAAPPAAQTQTLPAGIAFDPGWKGYGIDVAPDDHTLAVSVTRPHSRAALDVLDSRTATKLSQGRIIAAPGCDLLAPAYLPSKALAAIRVCGKKTDVVEVGRGSSLSSLGTLPSSRFHALDAAPDGRLLVTGAGTTSNQGFTGISGSYDIAANGKGGLHRISLANLPKCPGGGRPDRCTFDAESW